MVENDEDRPPTPPEVYQEKMCGGLAIPASSPSIPLLPNDDLRNNHFLPSFHPSDQLNHHEFMHNNRINQHHIDTLENECTRLEEQLRIEREEKRRIQMEAQDELTREISQAEDIWIGKLKIAMEERDLLKQKALVLEEQLDGSRADTNRAVAYRIELEDSRQRLQTQYDSLLRDYDETMLERSHVLEENNRLAEERDRLKQNLKNINGLMQGQQSSKNDTQIQQLQTKLDHTRRLLQLNMQESAAANVRRGETIEEIGRLKRRIDALCVEKEDLCARLLTAEAERESVADIWTSHAVDITMPFPKTNLGIILAGGSTPIYVKEVHPGSPLEHSIRRFDHIVLVNEIDVTDMDIRSIYDILRNSHHLKMVIRRRANMHQIQEVVIAGHSDIGLELANGVFVNRVEPGSATDRAKLSVGDRVIFVNGVPVGDARQAEELLKSTNGVARLGVLLGRPREQSRSTASTEKSSKSVFSKVHEKLFGGRAPTKTRDIIATANIDPDTPGDFMRHGSLRVPAPSPRQQQLIRTGSLRAPSGVGLQKELVGKMDQFRHSVASSPVHPSTGSTWPKLIDPTSGFRKPLPSRPSVFPVFPPPASPATTTKQSCQTCSCTSPSPFPASTSSIDSPRLASSTPRPSASTHGHRVSANFSGALPQPPPYPGRRLDASLSSILSSSNSVPHPSTSSVNYQINNSPSETVLSEYASEAIRRLTRSRDSEFEPGDISLERHPVRQKKHMDEVVFQPSKDRFEQETDDAFPVGIFPRWVQVPRRNVRICGGNLCGIVADCNVVNPQNPDNTIYAGDLILEVDGMDVRTATLEIATAYLTEGTSELVGLFVDGGGDRLEKIRAGTDGDGFYVRINVDRIGENGDELDIKAGEIVYVDNTLFMGQKGRWRAWKVDREGRQRQCGIIPSAELVHRDRGRQKGRYNAPKLTRGTPSLLGAVRAVYERVERVAASEKRPILLVGPYTAPFTQTLLDDAPNKFTQCVAECRALSQSEVERMLAAGEIIEARRRDQLFDVVSVAALQQQIDQGMHCLIDVSPSAINRLHALRIYPIVIQIKFKNSKQIKELCDENGEKIQSKAAKEWLERGQNEERLLEALDCHQATVLVSPHHAVRTLVKHVCQQVVAHVEHEQRKTLWVASLAHL
ncbi:unnamed protein product, partial [Mesorhabditis belari]|uniref:Uncharacterized protein n=1 Tax=Mesorhabditis belari TaxID=2138241 RepID=A0AAF3FNU3_9BILA